VQVLTSTEFVAQKGNGQLRKLPHGGWVTAAEEPPSHNLPGNGEAGYVAARPVKRRRPDGDADLAQAQEAEPSAAHTKRCSIM